MCVDAVPRTGLKVADSCDVLGIGGLSRQVYCESEVELSCVAFSDGFFRLKAFSCHYRFYQTRHFSIFSVLLMRDYIALPVCGHFSHLLTRGHMPYVTRQGAAPNVLPSARRAGASPCDPAPSHL